MLFEEVLNIPREQHGTITGILLISNDVVAFAAMLAFGNLSDRLGRRVLFALGIFILALGIGLNPFARGFADLVLIQLVVGVGFAGTSVMIGSMLQDYPQVCQIVAGHVHRTISGSTGGIPTAIFKSPCHQMPMALDPETTEISIDEPGAYGVLLLTDDGVIVHTEDFGLSTQVTSGYERAKENAAT